ncbi:MAG: hypothetical protein COV37_16420 [Bdellovibrio sp. CG11_big_fil_rev_8_21_14_0_20_39_38]|nr:MAG: hypothetical protein COV37_16420 [Bdellovibrio sp. CG11_big_fil_rev_8_21_14_0_20_39_38]
MFIIFLKFSENKSLASDYMEDHKKWIKKGIEDNVFMIVGSLQPNLGGGIIASCNSYLEVESRVKEDPFVEKDIVKYEIYELTPSIANEKFKSFLNK